MFSGGSVHYVNKANTSPSSPFTSWASAATNIQDAIDKAASNECVLVTNGIYDIGGRVYSGITGTNRVCITNGIIVLAVSTNPADTLIVGAPGSGKTNLLYGVARRLAEQPVAGAEIPQ